MYGVIIKLLNLNRPRVFTLRASAGICDEAYGGRHVLSPAFGPWCLLCYKKVVPPSFTCSVCDITSYNPNDVRHGYCGNCHAFTGDAA